MNEKKTLWEKIGPSGRLGGCGAAASLVAAWASGSAWWPVGIVSAGWLAMLLWHGRQERRMADARMARERQSADERAAQADALAGTLGITLARCAGELLSQMAALQSELEQARGLLMDAIQKLVAGFTCINTQTKTQQQLASAITSGHRHGVNGGSSSDGGFDHFVSETTSTLRFFVDTTVESSQVAMGFGEKLAGITRQVDEVEGILGEIEGISKQTSLLALNASIQASRAGQAGRGFSVVAEEVGLMSGRTSQFSQQIRKTITQVQESVHATGFEINQRASQDRDVAMKSKQQFEEMMTSAQNVHASMGAAAQDLATLTRGIESDVNSAVTTLHFQDMVTQLLAHVNRRAEALAGVGNKIHALGSSLSSLPAEGLGPHSLSVRRTCDELLGILENVRADTTKNPVSQTTMTAGEIEFF
jgi:methyl-accepting chemotaxis protein